jgi:hypothetical protein
MTDAYDTGNPTRPQTREPYRGRYRTNRRTGERQVWNGSTYVPETAASLAPEASEMLGRERSELDRLSNASLQGQQFLSLNSRQRTGSLVRRIPGISDLATTNNATLQQMENIQNSRVFDYMRGGANGGGISAQAANTPQEQARLERTGPTIANTGPANRGIVLGIQIDRDLQQARIDAMEQWARDPSRRSLEGFSQWWTQNAPRLRRDIQRRYEQTNGPIDNQAGSDGRQRPNPPPRPRNVPPTAQWDPDAREWVAP